MSAFEVVLDAVVSRVRRDGTAVAVGIAGAVCVGKTTIATAISEELSARGYSVRVLSTDSFLLPNTVLAERDLLMRKGFPETYDDEAIAGALGRLKRGESTMVPLYSHVTYDIVTGQSHHVEPADVILIEGVVALQPGVRSHLDLAIYVDAAEELVREWFVARFGRLTRAAYDDESSFYHRFAQLGPQQLRQLAEGTWDGINGPNLRDHIAPSKVAAQIVISKGPDHAIVGIEVV